MARRKRKSRRRHNPTRALAQTPAETSWTPLLVLGALGLGALLLGGSKTSGGQQPQQPSGANQGGSQDTTTPVSRLTPPAGVQAADEVVARVRANNYENALMYYIQSLPYIFGRTESLPTGESSSDRAAVISAVIRREIADVNPNWDGNFNGFLAVQLRKKLQRSGSAVRAIPYSFPPEDAGTIYALAAAADDAAINPFAPGRSIQS